MFLLPGYPSLTYQYILAFGISAIYVARKGNLYISHTIRMHLAVSNKIFLIDRGPNSKDIYNLT